jgi:hypothetical protein
MRTEKNRRRRRKKEEKTTDKEEKENENEELPWSTLFLNASNLVFGADSRNNPTNQTQPTPD